VVGIGLVGLGHGNFDISFAVINLKRALLSKGLLILFFPKSKKLKIKEKSIKLILYAILSYIFL
jgi:hypothetical protein